MISSKTKLLIIVFLCFNCFLLTLNLSAQIGINNRFPDSSAVLDIKAIDRGILIPRMSSSMRLGMLISPKPKPANGLLVLDTTINMFFFFHEIYDKWISINPWLSEGGSNSIYVIQNKIGLGTNTPSESLETSENIKADKFIGHGTIPIGGIIMWSGNPANIPSGFVICDGSIYNENTGALCPSCENPPTSGYKASPDLRGRFIVGYNSTDTDYNSIDNNAGNKYNTISHSSEGSTASWDNTSVSLLHNHQWGKKTAGFGWSLVSYNSSGTEIIVGSLLTNNQINSGTNYDDDYFYSSSALNLFTKANSPSLTKDIWNTNQINHSHTINLNIDNRPPYYTLAFIMRVY